MKKILNTFCVMAAFAALASCDKLGDAPAVTASLTTDRAEVVVGADSVLTADPFDVVVQEVYATLNVTASRSWTVSVVTDDGGAWVAPVVSERVNVSGSSETYPLSIRFNRYKGDSDRTAKLIFKCAEVAEPVEVVLKQEAYKPMLVVKPFTDPTAVEPLGGTCYAIISCNTSWSASIDGTASSVQPELDMDTGVDTKAVLLTFPDNLDDERARVATLVVEANDCEPQTLEFVQSQSDFFWKLEGELDGEVSPMLEEIVIPLRSNRPWKAEITDCTFANAKLVTMDGKEVGKDAVAGTTTGFKFVADHGFDPEVVEKHATVTMHTEGKEDIKVTFSQRGSIHLNFGHYNPESVYDPATTYKPYTKLVIPFSEPATFPTSYTTLTYAGKVTDCVMKNGGYVFTMFGADCGIWYNSQGQLWLVGKTKDDYVMFPAIDGYRLSEMWYEASCREAVSYSVRLADGSEIIEGGESSKTVANTPIYQEYNDVHVHKFPSTVAGERYRLNLDSTTGNISIKDLCLIYEKVD